MTMQERLRQFRELNIGKAELRQAIGEDLHNVECRKACPVKSSHVAHAIQLFQDDSITVEKLVEWVNTVWFTDLFAFDEEEADSIISVLEVLETMDEDGVSVSETELGRMLAALAVNTEYSPSGLQN